MSKLFGAGAALLGLALAVSPSWGQAPKAAPSKNANNRAFLGVFIGPTEENAAHQGAAVRRVTPDSPAARAGLRPTRRVQGNRLRLGDLIVALDNKPVQSANDLYDVLEKPKVGDSVEVTLRRDGQEQKVTLTLAEVQEGGLA